MPFLSPKCYRNDPLLTTLQFLGVRGPQASLRVRGLTRPGFPHTEIHHGGRRSSSLESSGPQKKGALGGVKTVDTSVIHCLPPNLLPVLLLPW